MLKHAPSPHPVNGYTDKQIILNSFNGNLANNDWFPLELVKFS